MSNNKSFIAQGAFLAAAGIISRIIGLIYRVPLAAIIGKTGNDYYGTAFEIYNIVLIISSYSIPLAMSKMVAARMAEGRVRDTKKVLDIGMAFAFIVGGTAFLVVYFFASYFAGTLLNTPNAALALRVLAPALFVVAILGVIRGFFQGMGTMVPTAISQVVEQIINAVVSVVAAFYLFKYGMSLVEGGGDVTLPAQYGAAGGTLGTLSGGVAALIFLILLYFLYKRRFKAKIHKDKNKVRESSGLILKGLIFTIIPVLLSTTLYNVSSIINQGIYKRLSISMGESAEIISQNWGTFAGQYRVLINVPVSISIAMAASIVPALVVSYGKRDMKNVRNKIRMGLRFISIVAIPSMVGYLVLSRPLMILLFNDSGDTAAWLLSIGSFTIFFYSISTLTNGVLQGIGRMSVPVVHASIALVMEAGLLYVLVKYADVGIYAVTIANIFESIVMFFLNARSIKHATRLRYNVVRTYVVPFISAVIMGIGVFLLYHALMIVADSNTVSCIASIVFGMVIYYIFMMLLGGINESELRSFPMGGKAVYISKKLGLLR